ncbi:hypothetical protein ACFPOA_05770 [Lysobacter niabensis]|uniref:hypothetical protein n=1 Tax=Agrilutibacter niabensis TaxID=380628 RepID=UPI00360B1DAB
MFDQIRPKFERRQQQVLREFKREEEAATRAWLTGVEQRAAQVGRAWPHPVELDLLRKLAELAGPFTAAQVGRKGWCGIRTTVVASETLERFVGNKWIFRLPPNRLGQARYAFTREAALGSLPHEAREEVEWPTFEGEMPDNRFTRGAHPLVLAGFLDGEDDPDEGGDEAILECEICLVPDPTAEGDIWAVARKLAFEEGTPLHRIAEGIQGLSPIQKAYALAIAQDRVGQRDSIRTHVRAIADYLGMDYNVLRAAVKAAKVEIERLEDEHLV